MRAVIYARVSSQAQKDKHTIGSQLSVLPPYVASRGWELVRPVTTYVDDGRTARAGHLEAREAFGRLLADAAAKIFDVVVVVDTDRLTRSEDPGERGQIYGAFWRAGVQIATPAMGEVDLRTFVGDAIVMLQAIVAAEENRKRRERSVRGRIEAARKGRKANGPTPYGLRYDRASGAWTLADDEATVIRECFERVGAGETCNRVGDDLAARGVTRPRSGKWTRGRVYHLVSNPAYRGEYLAHKALGLTIAVPRAVPDELWHRVQAMLPSYRRDPARPPRARHVSLLEGIARCGVCGAKVYIRFGRRGDRTFRYYKCSRRAEKVTLCASDIWRVEPLDELIWERLRQVVSDPDLFGQALERRRPAGDADRWRAELGSYERQLGALERNEGIILEQFRRGRVSPGAMERELAAAGRQRALLERNRDLAAQQVAAAQRSTEEADTLRAGYAGLQARLAEASAEERLQLTRLLIPGTDALHVTLLPGRRVEIAGRLIPSAARSPGRPRFAESSTAQANGRPLLFRTVIS